MNIGILNDWNADLQVSNNETVIPNHQPVSVSSMESELPEEESSIDLLSGQTISLNQLWSYESIDIPLKVNYKYINI